MARTERGWTEGPWEANDIEVTADRTVLIAEASVDVTVKRPQARANARLIAAAPDLYEALEALVERGTDSPFHLAAELALAKARGDDAEASRVRAALSKAGGGA